MSLEEPEVPVDDNAAEELEDDFVALSPLDGGGGDEEDEGATDDDGDDEEQQNISADGRRASAIPANYDSSRDLPPWMKDYVDYRQVNLLVALHNEIIAFCKLMEPRPDEIQQRQELVDRFTALVKDTFAEDDQCQVDVFGSQATGLCLPSPRL